MSKEQQQQSDFTSLHFEGLSKHFFSKKNIPTITKLTTFAEADPENCFMNSSSIAFTKSVAKRRVGAASDGFFSKEPFQIHKPVLAQLHRHTRAYVIIVF